jgi:hypothetical protein
LTRAPERSDGMTPRARYLISGRTITT